MPWHGELARISHQVSSVLAGPGVFTPLRSVGLLGVLSGTTALLSVVHLISTRGSTTSLRYLVRSST